MNAQWFDNEQDAECFAIDMGNDGFYATFYQAGTQWRVDWK